MKIITSNVKKCLILAVILLFIGVSVIPSTGTTDVKKSITPISRGDILYVGGDGPGNYTRIQDAIDDAKNGDTVFVFDNSSPYYENIVVDKSINLIGEYKETTIIDGSGKGDVVHISADWVNINGFKIRNGDYGSIYLDESSNNSISDNNITLTATWGIYLYHSNSNTISGNNINLNNDSGIGLYHSNNNTIRDNIISNNKFGIGLGNSDNNTISGNNISNNNFGLWVDLSNYNNITNNNIQNNERFGLFLSNANYNVIELNNFIGNKIQAFFIFSKKNNWNGNYWDNWIGLKINLWIFPKVIFGFPGINFDWPPAGEPYDI